ncbi:hypothetical protein PF001_g13779 [Phytophthora fragariae]|uniref:Uncharacterized protein n=1 Tax=Phytophthora fragariae TaxID=53985 RepID=A0A6A4DGK5_9STRA|nr:hypothetical protein PF001_g13779 [Phytophthora fragariae]KAE9332023.1 hypothetical protein PF008_g15142 [Phytophthora fragariae]
MAYSAPAIGHGYDPDQPPNRRGLHAQQHDRLLGWRFVGRADVGHSLWSEGSFKELACFVHTPAALSQSL